MGLEGMVSKRADRPYRAAPPSRALDLPVSQLESRAASASGNSVSRGIDHVRIIRIHTRVPVADPNG